jgi:hypothetical protein
LSTGRQLEVFRFNQINPLKEDKILNEVTEFLKDQGHLERNYQGNGKLKKPTGQEKQPQPPIPTDENNRSRQELRQLSSHLERPVEALKSTNSILPQAA